MLSIEDHIREIIRDEVKVRGCAAQGSVYPIPFISDSMTQIPLGPFGGDPDGYFTTETDGTKHLKIPTGLGGRYELFARLDWTKEQPYGGSAQPVWTVENATTGMLYAYPAIAGNPTHALPSSRLTATPVAHARHTWQHFHWQGTLNADDVVEFYVRQTVSNGETGLDELDNPTEIVVQATLTLDLRRPGIQY